MPIKQVLLDLDGVIFDFVGPASRIHGRPDIYNAPENKGIFDMEKLLGIEPADFWKPLNGERFWHELEKMPDADAIVSLAVKLVGEDNVAVLTAPSDSPYCIPGKRESIKRHYPFLAKRVIFGSCKEFCASPTRLLIDDRDSNVEAFAAAGGLAALVPRPWNKLYRLSLCSVIGLEAQIANFK